MIGEPKKAGFKPGDSVFIYPSANLLAAQGVTHTTVGEVCTPAYDDATGLLRVRVKSSDPRLWTMTLVSSADVCREVQKRIRTPEAVYPMVL